MKIIFAGTPDFAIPTLMELHKSHQIVAIFTQPDKASGRGKKIKISSIKSFAINNSIDVYQPENFNNINILQQIKKFEADVMVVVAYGQILPAELLSIPKYGCLNIHASILPKWRGAAPIQRALLMGDKITGISIMQMDEGLDTGDVLLEKTCTIANDDTALNLHDKLAKLGSITIIKALNDINNLVAKKQIGTPTYAKKLSKDEAWIDWDKSAKSIQRQIRAFNPYPIAQTYAISDKFDKKILRILSAEVVANNGKNGEIICDKNNVVINTSDGGLSLKIVQLAGKKAINIKDFNNAYKLLNIQT